MKSFRIKPSEKMSNDETINLVAKYQETKDIEIRNKIILGNIRLVYKVAHKFRRSLSHGFDDLVSEGIMGLIDCIEKFDTENHKVFGNYAYWHILKNINGSITTGTLNIPQHRMYVFSAYEKERIASIGRGEIPSLSDISEKLGISEKSLIDTISKKDSISLDFKISKEQRLSFGNSVPTNYNFEDDLIFRLDYEKTKSLIGSLLSDRERSILNYRFGLDGSDPLTLEETSEHLNISTEYVRVLQNKSLLKLRKKLTKK